MQQMKDQRPYYATRAELRAIDGAIKEKRPVRRFIRRRPPLARLTTLRAERC
jgi:hypothetical protein